MNYSRGGVVTMIGGGSWAALAFPAYLELHGRISYDTYNRLITVPLLLLLIGLVAVRKVVAPSSALARTLLVLAFALLLVGNVVEFWGALIFDQTTAQAAHESGTATHWIGSDIGWIVFGIGMLLAVVAGVLAAARSPGLPRPVRVVVALIGVGVLATNLLALANVVVSVTTLTAYGAGWILLGHYTRDPAFSRS